MRTDGTSWRWSAGRDPLAGVEGDLLDVQARVLVPEGSGFDLLVGGVLVRYDGERETLHCDGRTCCCPRRDGVVDLRVLVDRASIELYGAGRTGGDAAAGADRAGRAGRCGPFRMAMRWCSAS
ncbi:MAG: hypothetical protein ACOX2R_11910 [Anaerolineae bacterium]